MGIGFHRLSINDTTNAGMQPFKNKTQYLICNGEIYNYKRLIDKYNLSSKSTSDCECLLELFNKLNYKEFCAELDGVFAIIIWDSFDKTVTFARDPLGVRPLFVGRSHNNIIISSEVKGIPNAWNISPVKPGTLNIICTHCSYDVTVSYINLYNYDRLCLVNNDISNVRVLLEEAVKKRLLSDRPIGCLLSGGLDSTIITALVQKNSKQKVKTFSIGLKDSPDLKHAKIASDFIGTDHTEIIVTEEELRNAIADTIYQIESYDLTTVRASTPMFLLSKYIKENTDITVIFSGEGADEIFGSYLYFRNAPTKEAFQEETVRLLKDLHYFDILRGDRTTAGAGLEIRVPFLDKSFVRYCVTIPPEYKQEQPEKKILREAFKDIIPDEIYKRTKEAFSDGVSPVSTITPWYHSETELEDYKKIYLKHYRDGLVPYLWRPKWCDELDPSARKYI